MAEQFQMLFGLCIWVGRMKRQRCGLISNDFDHLFWFSLHYFVLVLFAFVVLGSVSSVLSQEIGWEERLQNFVWSRT